jgi:secreted Zn-dependent insulinase-like peptidase
MVSEHYSTAYSTTPLTGNTVANWRSPIQSADLALPTPNPFVPTQLLVQPLEREESILYKYTPQIIKATDNMVVWFEQDDEFKTPKTDIHILLENDLAYESIDNYIAMQLYLNLVNDALNEVRYEAGLAGSGYGINLTDRGIQIRLYGYQDKLQLLLDTLLIELVDHDISSDRFSIKRKELLRQLRNQSEDPVINQTVRHLNEWLTSNTYSQADKINAAEKISAEKLLAARKAWLADSKLTLLIHGNLIESQAMVMADRIDSVLPQQGTERIQRQIAKLPNRNYLTQIYIDHADAAYLQLHQGKNSSLRERALYALLAETLSAPYFAELRTREQLGYIVLARTYPIDGVPGLILYIQSPSTDPALIQLYSERFLSRYEQELLNMSDSAFNAYKQGLITSLKEPAKNLYELSSQYWNGIQEGNMHFNTQQRIATEIEKISLDGFRRFYENRLLGDEASSITIHQVGKSMQEDYNEHAEGIVGFYPIDQDTGWPDDVIWITPSFNNIVE